MWYGRVQKCLVHVRGALLYLTESGYSFCIRELRKCSRKSGFVKSGLYYARLVKLVPSEFEIYQRRYLCKGQ